MPKAWWDEGSLYNPINGHVDDEQRLYLKDLKDKNKWKRYELWYDLEWKIHKEGLSEEERVKQIGLNKVHYGRFTEGLKWGFDILTNKKFNDQTDKESKTVYDAHCVKPVDVWTKLMRDTAKGFEEVKIIGDLREASDENPDAPLWKTS